VGIFATIKTPAFSLVERGGDSYDTRLRPGVAHAHMRLSCAYHMSMLNSIYVQPHCASTFCLIRDPSHQSGQSLLDECAEVYMDGSVQSGPNNLPDPRVVMQLHSWKDPRVFQDAEWRIHYPSGFSLLFCRNPLDL
jgi:hypothetical protein